MFELGACTHARAHLLLGLGGLDLLPDLRDLLRQLRLALCLKG